ncbi:MAG: efflux RND transporter periplasmic adaptor subunit [Myxococcales bacterium FL481]|nr:MAG: efflux RND transporter periplasmic adaptor subunit [Myxococcales bacterium FL481]
MTTSFSLFSVRRTVAASHRPRCRRPAWPLGPLVGLSLFFAACGQMGPPGAGFGGDKSDTSSSTGGTGDSEPPTPVAVAAVEVGDIAASIVSASTIEAERSVTVHAEATGRIIKLNVEEGENVKKGQLLARLRYDSQSSQLARADEGLDKARTDLARVQALHRRGVASDQDLAEAQDALRIAKRDRVDRRRDVGNTRVLAPFAGTLTERVVAEGAFVSNGAQLFSLVDFDTLVARVYVPEKELDRIRVGQPARVVGKAAKGRRGTGTVTRIAPIVDAATGTVKVTVALPVAATGTERGFLPGMYAEVTLTTERREGALLVSKTALVRDEERVHVFVLESGEEEPTVKRTLVELGLEDDDRVQVVSGLAADQQVVVAGHDGLQDGASVVLVDSDGKPLADAGEANGEAAQPTVAADGPQSGDAEGT